MNMSRSVQIVCAFCSPNRNLLCRAAILGTLSILPAMFAANGPPPVTVNQPVNVQVINTEAAPVQTQDVDNPAFQPFQSSVLINFPIGGVETSANITVPAGKRLVIEFVSFRYILPIGQNPSLAAITQPATFVSFSFLLGLQGNFSPAANVFVGTSPTRLYFNPGTTLTIVAQRNLGTGSGSVLASISGYYVNVP